MGTGCLPLFSVVDGTGTRPGFRDALVVADAGPRASRGLLTTAADETGRGASPDPEFQGGRVDVAPSACTVAADALLAAAAPIGRATVLVRETELVERVSNGWSIAGGKLLRA